jgi:hypothetical protein
MAGREKAIILLKTAYGYHATDKLLPITLSVSGSAPAASSAHAENEGAERHFY